MKNKPDSDLKRIMRHAASGGDIYEALYAFYGYLRQILPVDRMNMFQYDSDRHVVRFIAQAADTGCEKTNFLFSVPEEIHQLSKTRSLPDTYIINEPEMDPIGNYIATGFSFSDWSALGTVFKKRSVAYGAIFFVARGRNRFTENHARQVFGLYNEHKWFLNAVIEDYAGKSAGPGQKEPVGDKYEFFRQVTKRLCGHLDLEAGVLHCLQYLSRFMPVAMLTVHKHFTNPMDGFIGVSPNGVFDYFNTELLTRYTEHLSPEGKTTSPKVVIINQPERFPALNRYVEMYGANWSALTMFLMHDREPLGIASVITEGKNAYTEEHRHWFSMLHDLFALALSNHIKNREIIELKNILEQERAALQEELQETREDILVGETSGLKTVVENARLVANKDSPVLLLGETGVGKEMIANFIHWKSFRRDGPLIKVNCGAIPETLVDSELFGHEEGSFTGAESRGIGRFERANGGTIFLDEIAEMTLQAQVRLIRVIQNKVIERVGGTETIPVDVRIIAATHRNLEELVASGQFREDLWFRLNVFPIRIPPLRLRRSDIPALVNHFIEKKSRELNLKNKPSLSPDAIDRLFNYEWPGNVRELENIIERELILCKGGALSFQNIGLRLPINASPDSENAENEDLEMDKVYIKHITKVLALAGGKINGPGGAAEMLKIKPGTLRNRMNKLGIPYGSKR